MVTEAGFASDLGAEKFMDIKCRTGGLVPSAAVIVATTRALAMHGEENLAKHVENIRLFGVAPVVALNRFTDDTDEKIGRVMSICKSLGVPCGLSRGWELRGRRRDRPRRHGPRRDPLRRPRGRSAISIPTTSGSPRSSRRSRPGSTAPTA